MSLDIIGAPADVRYSDAALSGTPVVAGEPVWRIGNDLGQGLRVLLTVFYRPGGPLHTAPGEHGRPACWLQVMLDTAYDYHDRRGRGCGELHAWLVGRLGCWLDERGVRWMWSSSAMPEVYSGYERLGELGPAARQGAAWAASTVRSGTADYLM